MANGVTTQWEDIHVKHGNYVAREKQETLAENYQKNINQIENYDQFKNKDLNELDELEDEFEKEFLDKYTQIRLKEMQKEKDRSKFGSLIEINREEYVDQVTLASHDAFVVLHLYQDYIQESVLVNQILEQLAVQRPSTKFVKITATKCADKFPDEQVPCFLIYRNGKIVSNLPRVHQFVKKVTINTIELLLKEQGVFYVPKVDSDSDDNEQIQQIKNPYKNAQKQDSNLDDEVDDREYSNNQKFYKKYM